MARKKFTSDGEGDPHCSYQQSLASVLGSNPRDREAGNQINCCAQNGRASDMPFLLTKARRNKDFANRAVLNSENDQQKQIARALENTENLRCAWRITRI
jgi:hypothetical protein